MLYLIARWRACLMREIYAYYKNATITKFNTFRLNPKADELYILYSTTSLYEVCKMCNTQHIDYKVIGLGANLVFDDSGFKGALIVNRASNLEFKIDSVIADSGVNLSNLIQKCYLRSLGGFESLIGIPATIGGAITNNVGAFDVNISDHVEWVKGFLKDEPNKKFCFTNSECKFAYRDSIFKSGKYVITHAKINLKSLCPDLIKENMIQALTKKKSTQPLELPSAGSVFKRMIFNENENVEISNSNNSNNSSHNKNFDGFQSKDIIKTDIDIANNPKLSSNCLENNRNEKLNIKTNQSNKNIVTKIIYPAKLIDELGLKGLTIGGAQISTKHAGFIVNIGNAKSEDIKKLVEIIKEKVKQNYNIDLIEEIEFLP